MLTYAGRFTRAVWNGPFWVGPLLRPVSVGDALLKFLETVWRIAVAILTIVILGVAIAFAWLGIQRLWAGPELSKQVDATVWQDPKGCPKPYPIRVRFQNESFSKTVGSIAFQLVVRERGRSTNLNPWMPLTTDIIIPPRSSGDYCWAMPSVTPSVASAPLDFSASNIHATEFQKDIK